jgi:hypothetical protein
MTGSSTLGIKTVLHPVSDLATAKEVYTGVPRTRKTISAITRIQKAIPMNPPAIAKPPNPTGIRGNAVMTPPGGRFGCARAPRR